MITELRNERSEISNQTANKELHHLKALFRWGEKNELIRRNPAANVEMMRIEKSEIRVPTQVEINKILKVANSEQQDYLWCLRKTLARSREINNLTRGDVDFANKTVTLFTRKKTHGTKTPRTVPMTETLYRVLSERYSQKEPDIPWVFWHRFYSRKENYTTIGPYKDRKKFMKTLCRKAEVQYFRFHPLKHAGATLMDEVNIPISTIQHILGHESRKTTEIYVHSNNENHTRTMHIFEQARMEKSMPED